ncbi:glycerol-3-phosphate acyltransferase 3 [Rhynchospora pubera]|uniref:Glycerol-3-phosphate acyltransferase 3 n=1 Tax=Rhynchospora pubera TaxID=906938 RepID=A0AAV8CF56_9POAL|nr:glycerol-3-phosphate acyltransferase 3 [Rhynchospora pubera]
MYIPFSTIKRCSSRGREDQTVVANLDGTILCCRSSFPYFALVAFETGGILRLLFLLVVAPLAGFLHYFISESVRIQVLIFASMAGAKVSDIESVARAVLPRFYAEDLHPETWRVVSASRRRYVLTANPTIMVEPFLKGYLGVDAVVGTEIEIHNGRATGFVRQPGVLVGKKKAAVLRNMLDNSIHIGLGATSSDYPYMKLCKEAYIVPHHTKVEPMSRDRLPRPIFFHDGRFVQRPTPLRALIVVLWIPVGFLLACLRLAAIKLLPMPCLYFVLHALGIRITVKGTPPPPPEKSTGQSGVLFACSHRTLLDPIFLSISLGRPVAAVTYSVSRIPEILSPIKTTPLSGNREQDAVMIKKLLEKGDLVICPEGTTCREPILLRFSSLFAGISDQIVPVAVENKMTMFHGTTVKGWKGMDSFFFFMNPSPAYEVTFLQKLPQEFTCTGGKSSHDVANHIQKLIASTLSYECTNFTRKDKYLAVTGNDGTVKMAKPHIDLKNNSRC